VSLGVERIQYVAVEAAAPEAAARYAVEKLGFSLAHAENGSYYLKAHGPDPYSLVYKPGAHGLDHVSFVVPDAQTLEAAADQLEGAGVSVERVEAPEWNHPGGIRFRTPAGHLIELATGVHSQFPPAHEVPMPDAAPAPICADHIGLAAVDYDREVAFMVETLGMLPSSRIFRPDGAPVMTFLRFPGRFLYHQVVVVAAPQDVIHHLQFSFKDRRSFEASTDALRANAVTIEWGPLRHGPGQNVALYFYDAEDYWVEYSTEEEIVLHDDSYVPMTWSTADQHTIDEWGSGPPPHGGILPIRHKKTDQEPVETTA
jgi:catechol 2,3-dioxygenase